MNTKTYPRLMLGLLAIGFIAFVALTNLLFSGARVDLTENRLYTISDGTREIIESIDEPLNLYFFFSDKAASDVVSLRTYATRVRELLEEYAAQADGNIRLSVIDPEPFSDAEDQAAGFGLQAVPLNGIADSVYFGLAATNAYGDQEVISFFQPEREDFLEYDISKLVNSLVTVEKPVIGLISGLPMTGGFDMMTQRPTPAWVVVEQLRQNFEVRTVNADAESLDDDLTELMIVHPEGLSDDLRYAIDQFVLNGGAAMVFVDPLSESARAGGNPMAQAPGETASDLPGLLRSWGVELVPGKVVGDAATALLVGSQPGQPPQPHLAFLGLTPTEIDGDDAVTGDLESINIGFGGALRATEGATSTLTPLLQSSDQSMLLDAMQVQMTQDPAMLADGFSPTGERYILAARLGGPATSAFDGPQREAQPYRSQAENINVIVVADTDLLADRYWVQVQDFFGQRLATAWADNGALVLNAAENLNGSSALISIRSRGRFSRPFSRVQAMRADADAKYRQSADDLQARLDETEARLAELEQTQSNGALLALSPEQEAALARFQDEKIRIRKELRDVRHQLDRDIEKLGMYLKVSNIVFAPIVLTLALLGVHRWRQRRRRRFDLQRLQAAGEAA